MSSAHKEDRPSAGIFMPFYTAVRGGPDVTAMWLIETLCHDFRVTLVTTRHFDLDFFNRFAATNLKSDQFDVLRAPALPLPPGTPMAALQGPLYQRFARRCAPAFDVPISAMNTIDFSVPAIHFLADLLWLNLQSAANGAQASVQSPLRRIYHGLCRRLYTPSGRDLLHEDSVVSSSRWMSSALRDSLAIESPVVHPPVPSVPVDIPWNERRADFVWIGRIAPLKNLEAAMQIVDGVRKCVFECKLHVVGEAADKQYGASIRNLAASYGNWIVFEGPMYGERKDRFLCEFRYALHTCWEDNFPITLVELIKSGCLAFGPHTFGSAEILSNEDLTFPSIEEAVRKITATIPDASRVASLRQHLSRRGNEFTTDVFRQSVLRIVEQFLKRKRASGAQG